MTVCDGIVGVMDSSPHRLQNIWTPHVTRRALLLGGASAMALAACGSSGSKASKSTLAAATPSLLAFFNAADYLTAGVTQRASFGVANAGGSVSLDTPATMIFDLTGPGGFHEKFMTARHRKNLPFSYYTFDFVPKVAGNYLASSKVDGLPVSAAFAVGAKGSSKVPNTGSPMPDLTTPTVANPQGINPICTNDPMCPLHTVSLDAALATKKPVAYLVATPKFCQTGICGPVLDVLLAETSAYVDRVAFIHQEVYQSAAKAAELGPNAPLAPAVKALNLVSEPVLFLISTDGTISRRLDNAYDSTELTSSLDALIA